MNLPDYFVTLYDYHYWANSRVLSTAAGLSDELFFRPQGHSWGSVHATLVHMLGAEWIWLSRCLGESPRALPGAEQFPDLSTLLHRWADLESEMRRLITAQTVDSLTKEIAYHNTRGQAFQLPLWQILAHAANHGTHHRGELAAMFAQIGVVHPEEDWLIYFLEKSGQR